MPAFVRRFFFDRAGGTAVIFALTLLPIVAIVAGGLDFSRSLNAKTKLQAALDSALLAAATMTGATDDERVQHAKDVFQANIAESGLPDGTTAAI